MTEVQYWPLDTKDWLNKLIEEISAYKIQYFLHFLVKIIWIRPILY